MYYSGFKYTVILFFACSAFYGCASKPHNDVLVFGTNTKVAFDVSADPANAGTPSFTLGYKRQELALVPLRANGTLINPDGDPEITTKGSKYLGKYNKDTQDAYSVFGSFGAKFGSGTENTAALSQFFATGIAAQRLGNNHSAPSMVSVQPVNSEVLKKQEKISELHKVLGEEKVKKIELERTKVVSDRKAKAAVIVMQVVKADGSIDKQVLKKAIKDGGIKTPWDTEIPKRSNGKDLNNYLVRHVVDAVVDSLYTQLK